MRAYERVTYRTGGGGSRVIYLENPTVITAGELGEMLTGVEVDREGEEVWGRGFDARRHVIAMDAVVHRAPVVMDLIYGTLRAAK